MARKKLRIPPAVQARIDATEKERMRAWAATRAFMKMLPALNAYVRAIGRDPTLRVQATAGQTRTDGHVVYIKPPLKLADNTPHEKIHCGKRDPIRHRQMCPACDTREMVMACIYHEVAHIIFGTMVAPTVYGLTPITDAIVEWHPPGVCNHIAEIETAVKAMVKDGEKESYLMWAGLLDPRLKYLINANEDARVNTSMFNARPGTRAMMDANVAEVFENGIEGNENEGDRWQDRTVEEQIFIGLFLSASEYFDYVSDLADEAQEVLDHPDIADELMLVARTDSIHEVVAITVRLWRRLQDMGYFVVPKCQKVDTPEEEENDNDPPPGLPSDCSSGDPGPSQEDGEGDGDGKESDPTPSEPEGSGGESGESNEDGDENGSSGDGAGGPGDGPSAGGTMDSGSPDESGGDEPNDQPSGDELQGDSATDEDRDPQEGNGAGQAEGGASGEPDSSSGTASGSGGGSGSESSDDASQQGSDTDSGVDPESDSGESTTDTDGDDADSPTPVGEADPDGDGDGGLEGEEVDPDADPIRDLLKEITLHRLIHEVLPESDTEKFACGHSEASGSVSESEDDVHALRGSGDSDDEADPASGGGWGGLGDEDIKDALEIALNQIKFFDQPSMGLTGLDVVEFPNPRVGWFQNMMFPEESDLGTFMPGEEIMGKLAMETKLMFEKNKRSRYEVNRKRGRVSPRHLGRRAPVADPRLMRKKLVPGKIDWHVVIGLDCSGSNGHPTLDQKARIMERAKRAVAAQTEVLSRVGGDVTFEVWAHTAGYGAPVNRVDGDMGERAWMLSIKKANEPWNEHAKMKLASISHSQGNVDGHTLQFYRKRADESNATNKLIVYYTDGAMPAMNYDEELEVLTQEIKVCRDKGYVLRAVGIETDSPVEHGLETVKVMSDDDLIEVVRQIKRAIGA